MKRVGLITMHKVLNAGSALQAYALYEKVKQLGYACELIDYKYPNEFHSKTSHKKKSFFSLLLPRIKYFLLYRSRQQKKRFQQFWETAWESSAFYPNPLEILKNPPKYDIYLAGSDQIWNPSNISGDGTFFCEFCGNRPKISYASSFAVNEIPANYRELYERYLDGFSAIGVRESEGKTIVKELCGKETVVVCDPTLLLNADDYAPLAEASEIAFDKPYILVYALTYAYNPYPTIQEVVDKLRKQTKLPVRYLVANSVDHYRFGKTITAAGPNEFVRLVKDAAFVVTSSFHGTAFAINFNIPFYAVVPQDKSDTRIHSLLNELDLLDREIVVGQSLPIRLAEGMDENCRTRLTQYRKESEDFLRNSLNSVRA